jgi:hypothetical protein
VKKKKKNTGRPYELLAQAIWQALNDQEGVANVKVQCNVTLQGNLTSHEIDLYWEFERNRVTYRTVVQAKDWINPVKQEQLIAFKKVLEDLPGQPRGIFVTVPVINGVRYRSQRRLALNCTSCVRLKAKNLSQI